jgi:hypothetical protein
MKKSLLLIAILAVFASSVFAKQYEFRVMAVKGNAEYYTGKGSWKKLHTGTKIYDGYKIKLAKKSYLGILHKTGKTLELKSKGKWTTKELAAKLNKNSSNVAGKLTNYIVDQLGEEDDSEFNYREGMETTGAVERSLNFGSGSGAGAAAFVQLKSPRKINFTTNSANFVWQKVKDENEYIFTITDRFDRIVHTKIISGNSYLIDADELKLKQDEYYFWHVACNNDRTIKSPDCAFSFLSQSSVDKINKEFEQLKSELGDENSALNQIVFGNFFEKNYLMDRALKHYKKAVELEPGVSEYQAIYTNFLKRGNF